MGDNGKVEKKFDLEIHIFSDSKDPIRNVAVQSNLKNIYDSNAMCETAKDILKAKIAMESKPKIQKSGILDFARRRK